jgi:hypothetical protein
LRFKRSDSVSWEASCSRNILTSAETDVSRSFVGFVVN